MPALYGSGHNVPLLGDGGVAGDRYPFWQHAAAQLAQQSCDSDSATERFDMQAAKELKLVKASTTTRINRPHPVHGLDGGARLHKDLDSLHAARGAGFHQRRLAGLRTDRNASAQRHEHVAASSAKALVCFP